MANTADAVISWPKLKLGVEVAGNVVRKISFLPYNVPIKSSENEFLIEAIRQLQAYLSNPDWEFSVPAYQEGTPFRRRVWDKIAAIRPGQTKTYSELARELASSPRAVGGACRANNLPIIIPCHRVVAVDHLGGFAGQTRGDKMECKRWLLQHEGWSSNYLASI